MTCKLLNQTNEGLQNSKEYMQMFFISNEFKNHLLIRIGYSQLILYQLI